MEIAIKALFHSYCAAENYCIEHNISEYTIDKKPHDLCYTLNYKIDTPAETKIITTQEPDERRDFIIGALVGYLEDKEDKSSTLESICAEVAKFYDQIEWVEIYGE